jgi:hypothetical protein
VWVALVINDVLLNGELRLVSVGWQGWVSLMVKVVLFNSGLSKDVVG